MRCQRILMRGDVHDETLRQPPRQRHRSAHVARPAPRHGVREAAARPGRGGGAEGAAHPHRLSSRSEVARRVTHQICGEDQVPRRRELRRRQPDRRAAALAQGRRRTSARNDRCLDDADDRRRLPRRAARPKQHRDAAARRLRRGPRHLADLLRSTTRPSISTRASTRCSSSPTDRRSSLFDGDELVGMSSFISASTTAASTLEIGSTYYRPHLRGTGFNRRVKDMMLRRAFDCGYPPHRVPRRQPQRAQPGGDGEARRGARRRDARRPHHLDRPRPRHRAVRDPGAANGRSDAPRLDHPRQAGRARLDPGGRRGQARCCARAASPRPRSATAARSIRWRAACCRSRSARRPSWPAGCSTRQGL